MLKADIIKQIVKARFFRWGFLVISIPAYLVLASGIINLLFFNGADQSRTDAPLSDEDLYVLYISTFSLFILLTWAYEKIFQLSRKGFLYIFMLLMVLLSGVFTVFNIFSVRSSTDGLLYGIFSTLFSGLFGIYLFLNSAQIVKSVYGKNPMLLAKWIKAIALLLAFSSAIISYLCFREIIS